jgi:hypothetical protein
MPKKKTTRRPKERVLKSYPSVVQMVAATTEPKFAVLYMADMIRILQMQVRRLELKVALLGVIVGPKLADAVEKAEKKRAKKAKR